MLSRGNSRKCSTHHSRMVGLRPQRMSKLLMPGEKEEDMDAVLAARGPEGRGRGKERIAVSTGLRRTYFAP